MAAIRVWCKWIHPTIDWRRNEHGTHKHAHGSWILWSVSRVRSKTMHSRLCITSQKLPYITILCYIDSRFFCLGTIAYGSIRLPPGSLASSRGRTFSITMGALVNKKNIPKGRLLALIGAKSNRYGTWYWIYCHSGYCYSLCDSLSQSWDTGLSVALFISVVITSSTKSMVSFTTPWTW